MEHSVQTTGATSPFVFDAHLHNATLLIAKYSNGATVTNPSPHEWLFSQASWGELSYQAYGLPTFEFHNELYGWIQERSEHWSEQAMEAFLSSKGEPKTKLWVREQRRNITSGKTTLMTYIRNFTHHPENTHNYPYSQDELAQSISSMLKLVGGMRDGGP
jgi:hypothetical protein